MPSRRDPDAPLPLLALTHSARARGISHDQARQRVRSGEWERVRHGAYLTTSEWDAELDSWSRARVAHVHRAIAACRTHRDSIIAFASAAFVYQLPVLSVPEQEVCLAVPPGRWTGTRAGVHLRRLSLPQDHVQYEPVAVTTPTRTWLDLACRTDLAQALAAGDRLLRTGLARHEQVLAMVDFACETGLPGRRRALRAAPLLDAARESPLESSSYAYFVDNRVPLPRAQVEIRDERGRFVARVDFLWEDPVTGRRVVGEADGRMKYEDADALYAEKRREDELRRLGYIVVRWGAADLRSPELARRILAAL